MGWDAYIKGAINDEQKNAFKEASDFVKGKTGSVDCMLEDGGLDSEKCGMTLYELTGESVYKDDGWPADLAKDLFEKTDWKEPDEDEWAYWSAKKFLEICAEEGLDIGFSF